MARPCPPPARRKALQPTRVEMCTALRSARRILRGMSKNSVKSCFLTVLLASLPLAAQTTSYRAPRADGGHPDLNGIWQVLNEANYDLEAHNAKPAMAVRPGPYGPVPAAPLLALGAVGSVPPGLGVVEGGEIPYKPDALA